MPHDPDENLLSGVMRQILDESPNGVVAIGPDDRLRYANGRAASFLGYDPAEMIGLPISTITEPARVTDAGVGDRVLDRLLARASENGVIVTARRKNGSRFPAECKVTGLHGSFEGWGVMSVNDVTDRVESQQAMRDLNRFYLTVAKANEALVRAADRQALYDDLCRIVVDTGGFLGAWVGAADGAGHIYALASYGPLDDYLAQLDLWIRDGSPGATGPTARTLRDEVPYYTDDFLTHPLTAPWRDLAVSYGIAASATLPLHQEGRVVATLSLYSTVRNSFNEVIRDLLEGVVRTASVALDRLAAAAERNQLLSRLVAAQEAERARIAADVHDEPLQAVAAADLRLDLLHRKAERHAPDLLDDVAQIRAAVLEASGRLRGLLFDLEPVRDDTDLIDALRESAAVIFTGTPTAWSVAADGHCDLTHATRTNAVLIAREALRNAYLHAGATRVDVTVTALDGGVQITVVDDGGGEQPHTWSSAPGHRGITTMHDRASVAGGWLRIEAAPDTPTGAAVRFWLPGRQGP